MAAWDSARRLAERLAPWLCEPAPLTVAALSLRGPRNENQDNYLTIAAGRDGTAASAERLANGEPVREPRPGWPTALVRLAVLDGMGGHRLGREIAESAALGLRDLPPCRTPKDQRRALLALHRQLRKRFAANPADSPGTTVVWAEIDRRTRRCLLASLGDSRAWLGAEGVWERLTHDHTLAEIGYREGRIDASAYLAECRLPGQRLAQALGYGAWGAQRDGYGGEVFGFSPEIRLDLADDLPPGLADHADLKVLTLPPGATLLLATDGFWSAPDRALPPPRSLPGAPGTDGGPADGAPDAHALRALAESALAAGGTDNTTLVAAAFASAGAS